MLTGPWFSLGWCAHTTRIQSHHRDPYSGMPASGALGYPCPSLMGFFGRAVVSTTWCGLPSTLLPVRSARPATAPPFVTPGTPVQASTLQPRSSATRQARHRQRAVRPAQLDRFGLFPFLSGRKPLHDYLGIVCCFPPGPINKITLPTTSKSVKFERILTFISDMVSLPCKKFAPDT